MTGSKVQQAVAGAGKTFWLVEQYVEMVVDAVPPLDPQSVVVITFTEAAARELVDRVRRALIDVIAAGPSSRAQRARQVLDGLGAAPIGTIHAFARRLLLQNAPAAMVPFGVEVVDELDPVVWAQMAARISGQIFRNADVYGLDVRQLQRTAKERPPTYLDADARELLTAVSSALLRSPAWAAIDDASMMALMSDVWTGARQAHQLPPGLLTRGEAVAVLDELLLDYGSVTGTTAATRAFGEKVALIGSLRDLVGSGPADDPVTVPLKVGRAGLLTKPMRDHCTKSGMTSTVAAVEVIEEHNRGVAPWQEGKARAYARLAGVSAVDAYLWGRSQGGADWVLQDELLQKSLHLILTDPDIAAALQKRYARVLLDEAQDVDATQRELLLRLAEANGMTVVGDPQQSIYGFRGADHATFRDLAERLLSGAAPQTLYTTRRSLPIIVRAVNAVFANDQHHTRMSALRADRGGSVTVLRADPRPEPDPEDANTEKRPGAADYRRAQADAIADQVVGVLSDADARVWDVTANQWRRPRPSDVAILVPSRTPVPDVEAALRVRAVPTTVRTSRDLARHPVAEGLAAALLAVIDPDDTQALLLALRSPLFAMTDEQITTWTLVHGRLRMPRRAPLGEGGDATARVGAGDSRDGVASMGHALQTLQRARAIGQAEGAGRAAQFLVNECHVLATLAAVDGEDWTHGWSQVRLLIDSVTDRQLNVVQPDVQFATWLREQLASAGSTNLSVLHEPHATGVTITTIHQAKGLQWPVVAVAALTGRDASTSKLALSAEQIRDVYTHLAGHYSHQPDAPAGATPPESARLMYVAMTRARDHLIISGIGQPAGTAPPVVDGDHIASCVAALHDDRATVVDVAVDVGHRAAVEPVRLDRYRPEHPGPGDVAARLAAVSASAAKTLARATPSSAGHESAQRQSMPAPDPDVAAARASGATSSKASGPGQVPSWRPAPRRAAAVGDYIHGVLERVDLVAFVDTALDLNAAVAAALPRGDDLSDDERLAALRTLGHARDSTLLVRAAAAAICRRELPISGRREDGDVLTITQGSIDLLFAESGHGNGNGGEGRRWVLVDYKTDSTTRSTDDFVAMYRPQLAVYEGLLAQVGIVVDETWLVRLTPDGVHDTRVR